MSSNYLNFIVQQLPKTSNRNALLLRNRNRQDGSTFLCGFLKHRTTKLGHRYHKINLITIVFHTFRAVLPGPLSVTRASLCIYVKGSVSRTIRQALQSVFIHSPAIGSFPSFLTDAGSFDAKPVTRARRVGTVDLAAELALVSSDTGALSVDAMSVPVAVRYLAFVVSQ